MRAISAKGGIGILLAGVLVVGAIGGWLVLRSDSGNEEPIVIGVTDRAESLDPGASYSAGSWDLYSNLFQGLLTLSSGSDTPVPDAAESCEFTDNAYQVYRCTLREGLRFSSGREVSPEDVKHSIERIQAMAQRAANEAEDESIPEADRFAYSGPISLVQGVEAVRTDGQDVIFELAEPDVTFPYVLAGGAGSIVDREEYPLEAPREDGEAVGSGPYVLTDYAEVDEETGTPGFAELSPNPDYRGAVDGPRQPVTIRYYPGPAELKEAWEKREIDVNAGQMAAGDIVEVDRNDAGIRYEETTGFSVRMLVNGVSGTGPTSDKAVRQALAGLLDRDAISSQVRLDTVEPAYSLIPVGVAGHGTPYYDLYSESGPEAVRSSLRNEGYELPVPLTFGYAGQVHAEETAFIDQMLEADGIFDITVEEFQSFGDIFAALQAGDIDSYFVGWRPDFSDPDTYTAPLLLEDSVLSHGYANARIAQLVAETKGQPQRGSTTELFREIQAIAAEDAVVVPIWQDWQFTVAVREITGLTNLRDAGGIFRLWELDRL
ncbi:ABC transporter substrate-binding protein [Streptomyces aidingensis]|uniref:Peptide/nickel transport system substrate-binding protein n=1 Tax=Streptomyces aidingensis TaxID=910347 RepID=A0A1I1EFM7_9ACTN|nr:ABC transporter substrate-binding protein [Streptomyces aidingensis]SFB85969.1 peptide/nickel transport system substrate-binding protein [Streptomyces aidingensis]